MRGRSLRFILLLFALALALAAAGCGGDEGEEGGAGGGATETGARGGTLVFGAAADPVALDGALVSDVDSIRVITQLFETLVFLKPGTTEPEPGLAESWKTDDDGKTWTFKLRQDVKFHDGTDFSAEAVCFNFDRWYKFEGSLQDPRASYYWQAVFGGFATKDNPNAPSESLYESCKAQEDFTAVIHLTRRSAAIIPALARQAFSIASPKALQEFKADAGSVDEEGVFHPSGTFGTEHPAGTGPFQLTSWAQGDTVVISRFDDYWGEKPKLDSVIFRPIPENAARLQALQAGEISGYDLVEPEDIPTIESDESLQLLDRPAFNVAYVGINQALPPMNKLAVRQAVAYGLNRQEAVDSIYTGRGEVAKEFMPPEVTGFADNVTEYAFDPDKAKQLLRAAGLKLPVEVTFWYPSDVSRPYMPDPKRIFEALKTSLEQSGFRVTAKTARWTPNYLGNVEAGKTQLYLLGRTGDYGDADSFLGTLFQAPQTAWGTNEFPNQEVVELLDGGETETDEAKRDQIYQDANRAIMDWLPGVPYAHSRPALAFSAKVQGYVPSPTSNELFSTVSLER
jgi:peptide/nickel transport system substrate-binding protein